MIIIPTAAAMGIIATSYLIDVSKFDYRISGMYAENAVTVAKRELAWEVDYQREAQCQQKMK